jgi:hypothetical protein
MVLIHAWCCADCSGELAAVRQQLAAKETAAAGLREELQAALLALPEPPAELLGVHRDGAEAEAYNNCLNNCEQVRAVLEAGMAHTILVANHAVGRLPYSCRSLHPRGSPTAGVWMPYCQ